MMVGNPCLWPYYWQSSAILSPRSQSLHSSIYVICIMKKFSTASDVKIGVERLGTKLVISLSIIIIL